MFFFFNDTATTEIYTLSLHDALPISLRPHVHVHARVVPIERAAQELRRLHLLRGGKLHGGLVPVALAVRVEVAVRSEEHTSELQSRQYLVCPLLLGKKKKTYLIAYDK